VREVGVSSVSEFVFGFGGLFWVGGAAGKSF